MRRIMITVVMMVLFMGSICAQNGIANIPYKEKLIFYNSIPTKEFTIVGNAKYSNSKSNEAKVGTDPTGIKKVFIAIEEALDQVNKGKKDDFDAALVESPTKIELIKFDGGTMHENAECTVPTRGYSKKCGEKDIFFFTIPNVEFTEVLVVEVKNFSNLGQMKMGKNDIDNFFNKLYEKACKEGKNEDLDFDGIMVLDDNIVVNGFFSSKTLLLIKYK